MKHILLPFTLLFLISACKKKCESGNATLKVVNSSPATISVENMYGQTMATLLPSATFSTPLQPGCHGFFIGVQRDSFCVVACEEKEIVYN